MEKFLIGMIVMVALGFAIAISTTIMTFELNKQGERGLMGPIGVAAELGGQNKATFIFRDFVSNLLVTTTPTPVGLLQSGNYSVPKLVAVQLGQTDFFGGSSPGSKTETPTLFVIANEYYRVTVDIDITVEPIGSDRNLFLNILQSDLRPLAHPIASAAYFSMSAMEQRASFTATFLFHTEATTKLTWFFSTAATFPITIKQIHSLICDVVCVSSPGPLKTR